MQPTFASQPRSPIIQNQHSPSPTNYGTYGRNGSLPRSSTPQEPAANLSELDTLLQDLSSARYASNIDKQSNYAKPSPVSQIVLSESIKRPSVDSLLEELSNAQSVEPIYALPNG